MWVGSNWPIRVGPRYGDRVTCAVLFRVGSVVAGLSLFCPAGSLVALALSAMTARRQFSRSRGASWVVVLVWAGAVTL